MKAAIREQEKELRQMEAFFMDQIYEVFGIEIGTKKRFLKGLKLQKTILEAEINRLDSQIEYLEKENGK